MKNFLLSAKKILFLLPTLIVPIIVKCQDVKTESKDDYKEIVIEIPPVVITRYEYEKNLNEYKNMYRSKNNIEPSKEILDNWRKDFLDRMYLLTELYNRGDSKRQDIINVVNSMERIILTQDHGLVYDEYVTKKVNVPEEAVKAAYERSGKHIKVEYLIFPDNESLISMVSTFKKNGRIQKKDDFNTLKAICKDYPHIICDSVEFVWPYLGMESIAEKIYNLNKDEIIPAAEMTDGIYVYWAKDVYSAEKNSYDKIQSRIRKILEGNEEKALRNAFYDKVDSAVSSNVDEEVCYKFMKKYDIELFKDFNVSKRTKNLNIQFKDILNDTVLTYSFDSVKSLLTVENFINLYSQSVMLPVFKKSSDLSNYLSDYAREEYLMQLADSLVIRKSIKHQLNKKNYKNKTILSFYEARELMPAIQVSDDEIEKYYQAHQSDYLSGDTAEISVYTFDNERNAYRGMMNLQRSMKYIPKDKERESQYEGLKQLDSSITLTRNDGKYSKEIMQAIFKLKDDQYSQPIKLSGDFIVLKKIKETGSIVKSIEEVRDDIIKSIKKIKFDEINDEKIIQAKKKYQIRVNKTALH